MSSLNQLRKRIARWDRYYLRTVKPLQAKQGSTAEMDLWGCSGYARTYNRWRRGEVSTEDWKEWPPPASIRKTTARWLARKVAPKVGGRS